MNGGIRLGALSDGLSTTTPTKDQYDAGQNDAEAPPYWLTARLRARKVTLTGEDA